MSFRSLAAVVFSILLAAPAVALSIPDVIPASVPDVEIKRDTFGVPHIYAEDAYALFWGNGYAQAEDRLFQMDALRHVGKGDSARFLGPAQLPMDLATRRELYTDAERTATLDSLSPEYQRMFAGFTAGVNAFILETRADPTKLSAEFYAIGHAPEDWVEEDTIAVAQFLLDIFGAGSGGNELDNAKVYKHLVETLGVEEGRKAFSDFFWMEDPDTYTTITAADGVYTPTEAPMAWEDIPQWQWDLLDAAADAVPFADGSLESLGSTAAAMGLPAKFGSNALVIGPSLSENGEAMLIGGPQMAYYNPMIPYEVALHGAGFSAVGMGVGGAPGVIIGRNDDMAWTVTSGSSDQVDVVAVKLSGPREYYVSGTSGATKAMDCRVETHFGPPTAIDQNPPQLAVQEVCRTDAGPVFAINEEAGYAFSRLRTHRLDEVRSGALWLTISQATDMDSFAAHMETFRFEFNFHVADSDGNIGYYHFGANPDRSEDCDPRLPRLAGLCDWEGVRTGSQLPHVKNPSTGYIANWNNKPALGWSSGDAMEKWGSLNRVTLIDRAVQAELAHDGSISLADMRAMNYEYSVNTPYAAAFAGGIWAAGSQTTGVTYDAAVALRDWEQANAHWVPGADASCKIARAVDACFGTYEPGFIIYEEWLNAAHEKVLRDELGPYVRELGFVPETSSDPHAADHGREDNKFNVLYDALAGDTSHDWLNGEAANDLYLEALDTAVAKLTARFGTSDVDDWREPVRTIKFSGLSGGPSWRIPMVNRPSFTHYYDFGSGEAGSNLPPGTNQYWEPLPFLRFSADGTIPDAHKDDQLKLYVDFEYKPAQMTPPGGWESERAFDTGSLV